jgi:hypothetical protein
MVWLRGAFMAVALVATLTALPAPALAQTSVTYSLAGVETAATSTEGTFVGVAQSADDFATWAAVIAHDALDPLVDTVPITGGTFALNGHVRDFAGVISGGEVVRLTNGRSCRNEKFDVTGSVTLTTGALGSFQVTLTHYRQRVAGGGCVTFFATVEGLITVTTAQ